jgi:hypothetical protein
LNRRREPRRVCVFVFIFWFTWDRRVYRAGDRFGLNLDPYYNSRTAAAAAGDRLLGGEIGQATAAHTQRGTLYYYYYPSSSTFFQQ